MTLGTQPCHPTDRAGEIARWKRMMRLSRRRILPALAWVFTVVLSNRARTGGGRRRTSGGDTATAGPALINLRQVRELSPNHAAEERLVRLEGQLSFVDHSGSCASCRMPRVGFTWRRKPALSTDPECACD